MEYLSLCRERHLALTAVEQLYAKLFIEAAYRVRNGGL